MSRRSFIYRLGGVALGLFGWGGRQARADGGRATTLTILHTNGIHGHLTAWKGWEGDLKDKTVGGFGRLAGAVAQARKTATDALLLDAGDLIGDSMIADLTEGKAMVEAVNHLGYDAMSIGNHEPDFGTAVLRERVNDARRAQKASSGFVSLSRSARNCRIALAPRPRTRTSPSP
jgi:2',3'-cyclic-nucleotide 2'-phosphodiesterase (5'-nucleotidase family)